MDEGEDLWEQWPEEEEEDPNHNSQTSEAFLIGFVIADIVGLQYYSGTINGREMVGLLREPLNPFDPNAIRVLNTRLAQVGHVDRHVAAALAPLLDSGDIAAAEGIVPKRRAAGNRFRIPCQIHLFARPDSFAAARASLARANLPLIAASDAAFGLSEAAAAAEKKSGKSAKSVDRIFALVDKGLAKRGRLKGLDPSEEVVKSKLFEHQREGLWWLMQRENSGELPPFWEEEKEGGFVNVLTNFRTDSRPEPIRGGVFADDMGLGKTLTLLSLIAFDKNGSDDGNGGTSKNGSESRRRKRRKVENDDPGISKTTLIVCPPSVFSTWIAQLDEHTHHGSFKVYMYYGERTDDVEELKNYDIVLTTYSTLGAENSWPRSAAKEMKWWRVILDEAHMIKNAKALQSRAVCDLKADRRWVVTGTPIQNSSFDLFSLMAFLRFEPFSVRSYWQSLVQRPLAQGNEKGLKRLQVLMATISLRRTKEKGVIGLPQKTIETSYVDLSREERELYDQMERAVKDLVQGYINAGSQTRNYTTILSIILRLRQICTDPALCPSDIKSMLPSNNIEDVSKNPELLQKIVEVLQDGEDFDCPICIAPPTDMVITCCGHIFCHACILKTLKHTKSTCPICRRALETSDLFSAPPPKDETPPPKSGVSSKVSRLLKLLTETRDENPGTKSVVFSQFRKMLTLLEKPLEESGFKTLRIDGSMNAKKRAQVIRDFGSSEKAGPTVLLASLKAAGTGITLTAASRVYFFEPWWNPAVEMQAMDRVHRIGQREEVKVVRLIARDTIEERVLKLQEGKEILAREAFGKRGSKDRREIGIDDLRTLMSM